MHHVRWTVLAVALAGAACTEPTRVSASLLVPAQDTTLDPARLAVGDPLYSCGVWQAAPPAAARLTVDIVFGNKLAALVDRPSSVDLALIQSHGGEVLYQFHLPAVRASIAGGEIAKLASAGNVATALTVKDLRRYDLRVLAIFARPPTAADSAAFAALGGKLTENGGSPRALSGLLPDRSIPALRARAGIAEVKTYAGCG